LLILVVHFQFSAGLHPQQKSSILTVDPFSSRASLTCSCAQDYQTMKVSKLKDLLRVLRQPVTYSTTNPHLMTVVLGSVTLYQSSDVLSTHGRGQKQVLVSRLEQLQVLPTCTSIYTSAHLPVFLAFPSPCSAHIDGRGTTQSQPSLFSWSASARMVSLQAVRSAPTCKQQCKRKPGESSS
jgi:hypothetical protein